MRASFQGNKSSIVMSSDIMSVIKNISQDMSEQINLNKRKEIHMKAEEVLTKMEKDMGKSNKKDSILDLNIFQISNSKQEFTKPKKYKAGSNKSIHKIKVNENSGSVNSRLININNTQDKSEQSVSERDPNDFYTKQQEYLNQHELKMNHMRKEKLERERQKLQEKPKISNESVRIYREKMKRLNSCENVTSKSEINLNSSTGEQLPFYLRAKEIKLEQDERKDQLKKMYEMIEKSKEEKINPNTINVRPYDPETFESWRKTKMKWKETKELKSDQLKKDISNKESQLNFTFQPELNKDSMSIINNKFNDVSFLERTEIFEDARKKNKNKILEKTTEKFCPSINRNLPKYIRSHKVEEYKQHKDVTILQSNHEESRVSYEENSEFFDSPKNVPYYKTSKGQTMDREYAASSSKKEKNPSSNHYEKDGPTGMYTIQNREEGEEFNNYYNLNVRDNSAWNDNKENFIVLNSSKYNDIMGKLLDNNNSKSPKKKPINNI